MSSEATPHRYSWRERTLYFVKRNVVFLIFAVPAFLVLISDGIQTTPDGVVINPGKEILMLLAGKVLRSVVGLWLALMIMKFYMPRMSIQTELIEDQNIAVAIVVAAVVLAMNL